MEHIENTPRREFLGKLTTGAVAGFAALSSPFIAKAASSETETVSDADEWFKKLKGTHRIVFDATRPHEIFPFAWPRVFLMTNEATGSPANDCGVVVVLRHDAIGYAMEDRLWAKYKFGELFKANDPATGAAALRNPFAKPKPGDFKIPGVGPVAIGINELQANGAMFCVCDVAMGVYSAVAAKNMQLDPAEAKKEWVAGLLPGIQVVPSGVWALGRAQEHGCSYCFAG